MILNAGPLSAYTHENLTVTNAVKMLTTTNLRQFGTQKVSAREVFITTETDSIRYTVDGTTPSTTVGHLVPLASTLTITGLDNIMNLKMFRVTTDATVKVTYFT